MTHLTFLAWDGPVLILGPMVAVDTMGLMDTMDLTMDLTMGPIMDLIMGLTMDLMGPLALKDVLPGWGPVPT